MPDDSDKNCDCREVQTRRNWWYNARGFMMCNCGMYDISDNANLKLLENNINANIVVMVEIRGIG